MDVPFIDAKQDVAWTRGLRQIRGTVDGVDVTCESRWWGQQWTVTGESEFPVPERLIVFVSARGMDHGFWRDLRVGEPRFDARFFVFCDTPALLPIVVGEATRRALTARDGIELYVRGGRARTRGVNLAKDTDAIDHHVAIHRALGDDHRAFVARWQRQIGDAQGRADARWPPTAMLLRPTGALLVNLTWETSLTRDSDWEAAASMRTEVTVHDDRPRKQWSLREVGATAARTHLLAGRPFVLLGELPIKLAIIDDLVERAQIASVVVHVNRITVGLHGVATAKQLDGAVRVIQLVVDATMETSSPYR